MEDSDVAPPEWDYLLSACQKNQPDKIRKLVEQEGVSPSHSNPVGQSALHVAAIWGHVECVKILLELGADVKAKNQITGATALHCAVQSAKSTAEEDKMATIELLLDGGANPAMGDLYGSIPFDYCDEEEDKGIRELLKPDIPPIFLAVDAYDQDRVEELLKADETIVNSRFRRKTAILRAVDCLLDETVEQSDTDSVAAIVQLLLKHGADANASLTTDRGGHLVAQEEPAPEEATLHRITMSVKEAYRDADEERISTLQEVAMMLKEHGAAVPQPTVKLLHDATRRGMIPMTRFLVETLKVDPNARGRQGMTPIQFAARSGQKAMVEHLLSNYAIDLSIKDDRGKTALDAAKANNKTEIVDLLEGHVN